MKKTSGTKKDSKNTSITLNGCHAILTFQLPQERESFDLANRAIDYSIALDDVQDWLRTNTKYGVQQELKDAILTSMNEWEEKEPMPSDHVIECILWRVRDKIAEIRQERDI
jgi:hypothetical protein